MSLVSATMDSFSTYLKSCFMKLTLNFFQPFVIKTLQQGPIPEHLSFLCDGNRRYGKSNNLHPHIGQILGFYMEHDPDHPSDLTQQMKERGPSAIKKCIMNSYLLGCKHVTIYSCSAENLQRDPKEVTNIWYCIEHFYSHLYKRRNWYNKLGIRIRHFGALETFPKHIQEMISGFTYATRNNTKMTLTFLNNYTFQMEMVDVLKDFRNGLRNKEIEPEDITGKLITQCLYGMNEPAPDLMIRTSSTTRLSNFYLWQMVTTRIDFVKKLFPEFGFWDLVNVILQYQNTIITQEKVREQVAEILSSEPGYKMQDLRIKKFLDKISEQRYQEVISYL